MVVKINKDSKLCYFDNTETSKNSKLFWNECKPYFSNKHAHGDSAIIKNSIIKKFHNHPSIMKLKSKYKFQENFF